jgi:amino-acid N-acetyltransferase
MYRIRKAVVSDVPRIYDLLKDFGQKGVMLPRSLSELYDVIRAFLVAAPEERPDELAGVCALHVCWEDLGEIRSLAVAQEHQGTGLGGRLLAQVESDARELGVGRLFVLTYIPDYFARFGYQRIEKSQLPHKIWADCIKCINFPNCDEVALLRPL